MKYVTGVFALNIDNSMETCGDWHASALNWANIRIADSDKSIFKDWGIEGPKNIPEHKEKYFVANDLRALLDIMQYDTRFLVGMRNDFICTDIYDDVFFEKVWMLKDSPNWKNIDRLMEKEYMMKWVDFRRKNG